MPRGDFKDQTIEELRSKLHASQREVANTLACMKSQDETIEELRAEIVSLQETSDNRWITIRQLQKERDFYQGAKLERESTSAIDELIQERAAIQAAEGSGLGGAAKSEILHTGLSQIPLSALRKIGSIFVEGQLKYGRDNWKKGAFNKSYQLERAEHALVHFLEYLHQESNDGSTPIQQLAKVAWFCVTQIDTIEREDLSLTEAQPRE
jgi:predicted transcriptional regulator